MPAAFEWSFNYPFGFSGAQEAGVYFGEEAVKVGEGVRKWNKPEAALWSYDDELRPFTADHRLRE